ncbi:hypothetical protein RNAN_1133 [Rheinheimera nanhaiensis E407-8]|uniref:Uncharacterized protein n=1 Tax=Rheinheimera nanhaiensis E407-8 TaxID=562729 RepID=I1DVT4_9GAMM|nr:hypothetical protein RNAN_1133 [Rheinheimera nanhaiensis E407-8]
MLYKNKKIFWLGLSFSYCLLSAAKVGVVLPLFKRANSV